MEYVQPREYAGSKFYLLAVVRFRHDADEEQAVCQPLERSGRRRLYRSRRVRANSQKSARRHFFDAIFRLRNGRTLGKNSFYSKNSK